MRYKLASFILAAAVWLAAACGPRNLIVLVPDPDGSVGKIRVANSAGSVEIDAPNRATVVPDEHTAPRAPAELTTAEIRTLFGEALAIQPTPPVHFILYFEKDSNRLNAESSDRMADVLTAIRQRASKHIGVVGHSDTLGDRLYNQDLSMRRAAAVRDLLIQNGVPGGQIETTSHGEKNLLIKTGDNVGEPKNRRVEVVIR
jgi:outer membrane protein OmpA-like peptidoglycan-associated protein